MSSNGHNPMIKNITNLIIFVLFGIFTMTVSKLVWGQTASATAIPREIYTYFPSSLVCNEVVKGNGPSTGLVTIGKTTLQELDDLYSQYLEVSLKYSEASGETLVYLNHYGDGTVYRRIDVCLIDGVIVAARGDFPSISQIQDVKRETEVPQPIEVPLSFEYLEIKHFVAKYGLPNTIAYSPNPTHRVAFWFEQGIAVEFYVVNDPSQIPPSFGAVSRKIYFPFQDAEGYETRWPFNQTYPEEQYIEWAAPFVATDVPTDRNPFDFEAIVATITAQPTVPPTATHVPPDISPTPVP